MTDREGWLYGLNHGDWAEEARVALAQDRPIPDLPPAWQGYSRQDWLRWLEPPYELSCEWQLSMAERYEVYIPLIRVDPWLWRGPQPDPALLQKARPLAALINLRRENQASRQLAEQHGLGYVHLAVRDMSIPTRQQVADFLAYFHQESPAPALVHCFAGQGRTGLFVAAYRIYRGMEVEAAIHLTDQETGRHGMRPCQRRWVLENREFLCNLFK